MGLSEEGGSRGAVFSRIAGPREGGGASEVREVNLAGIPQLQMLHEALSFYTIRGVNSLSGGAARQPAGPPIRSSDSSVALGTTHLTLSGRSVDAWRKFLESLCMRKSICTNKRHHGIVRINNVQYLLNWLFVRFSFTSHR